MPRITPFLWFDSEAEEAAKFYTSIFKRSKVLGVTRYGKAAAQASGRPEGSVMTVRFRLDGQEFVALNGGPVFRFTEAVSFVVSCDTQRQIDAYWKKLTRGGKPNVCGWLKDRYGLSWQIVPRSVFQMLESKDQERSRRVHEAVLKMTKLDIKTLKRAYEGGSKRGSVAPDSRMGKAPPVALQAAGRDVEITNPDKVFFPKAGHTKLDLAKYYLAVADGALRGIAGRPFVLKRYVDGAEGEAFYQKRAPEKRPDWIETVELAFPSGRTARELVVRDAAQLLWVVNLGCIDLNPHPVRADDLEHPDELRVDLDPVPGVAWDDVRRVAMLVRDVLEAHGLRGWPKTSGSRGMHVNVRIERRWGFDEVRRAALALAREVERRAPEIATSKWWKEERHGVFLDYNQNAKDRTVASAWSVRATPDARVSMPLEWDEVPDGDPAAFTLTTAPERFAERGDAAAGIDDSAGSLEGLLALSAAQEAAGQGDAPWPPHYKKQRGEPTRVAPSRKKKGVEGEPRGARRSSQPLRIVAKAKQKEEALAGLERWKSRHPEAAARLQPDDVLVDSMRGRSSTWTRIRVNLRSVPEGERPAEEPPDPDYDPWREFREGGRPPRAPKTRSSS